MNVKRWDLTDDGVRYVLCPGCGARVLPGQAVERRDDPDPWRCLWHLACLTLHRLRTEPER